jgi:hypothetical protein
MTDTATTPVDFTRAELLALADILGRVKDGAATGAYAPLREAALFSTRDQFATAHAKISGAALAAVARVADPTRRPTTAGGGDSR